MQSADIRVHVVLRATTVLAPGPCTIDCTGGFDCTSCRVRETSIIVAVDEPPEEGLEQPLRLEKLANEVGWPG